MKKLLFLAFTFWFLLFAGHIAQAMTDVSFVMDGSGSIDSTDFRLQKDGIIAALNNSVIVPRDGSIAVALVQFGDNTTRVEISYTIISDDTDVTNLVAQVNAISQIQSSTNPGDGINRAMDVLNGNGRPVASQGICLSTDGLPNAGADVATALNNAKASSIVLDRFGVIAIEDPPFYYADDFHSFYDPLVFGGGAVAVVRNATEFANTVGAACFPSDLELIGLEVNQAIQDWENNVQLIEDKTTYVRAHIQTKGPDPAVAVARLRGFRGGAELPQSPLTAINPGGAITARPNATARRANWDDSLNFRLPPSWLNGTVELRVEGIGGGLDCQEAASPTSNDCSVQVTFNSTDEPEVRFVAVRWTDAGGTTHNPTAANLTELANRLVAIYPIATLDWTTGSLNWTGTVPPDLTSLSSRLESMRFWDFCWSIWPFNCERLYYGNLVGAPSLGGLANGIPGTVASGDMGAEPNVHAHELGHLLGRRHATYCGAQDPAAPPFPYTAVIGGRTVATLGPMNLGQDSLIFGLDINRMRVLDPNQNFELMSYCTPLWISKFTYDGVRTAINNTFSGPVSGTQGPTADYLVVRGTVDFKNDTADFIPFGVISSTVPPPVPPTGDYTLQLQDASGSPIQSITFEPTEYHAFGGADPEFGTFIIPVPADTDIKQAVVLRNGATLTFTSASLNPPSVQVIFPNGGENLSEDPVVIEWSGSDPDGDSLTYLVQYSADGGATWETLVTDWPDESYEIGLNFLAETTQGLIMVMASDGFNSATDESDGTFSVPNHQPEVWILSPPENALFTGVQTIFFEALAQDREDGSLSGSSIQWMSGIDGFLGTGEVLNKDASTLSEGNHVITVTATDSGGLTATATVNIRVFRIAPANNPPVADAGPDQTIDAGPDCMTSVTLDGSGSADPNGDPLTYTWTNSFGAVSSPTPTVTLPLGTHTITLTVDDGKGGTASDTVDITVEDTTPPAVNITFPPPLPFPGVALQDGVTFTATASDDCGVAEVYFSVREPGATDGIDLTATFNTTSGNWESDFDTTLLPDGYYVLLANALDENGNEGLSDLVPFSIRNWAVVQLLPASRTHRAGRTMPVKFSLRIAAAVDPAQPFVYNDELEIRIYDASDRSTSLQTSLYGDTSTDYRINTIAELYITNFKTSKQPAEYVVEIWRVSKNFLIGSFTFETTKK